MECKHAWVRVFSGVFPRNPLILNDSPAPRTFTECGGFAGCGRRRVYCVSKVTIRSAQSVGIPDERARAIQDAAGVLQERQLKFADLVLTVDIHGMSRTNCYKAAGYTARTDNVAAASAVRLLRNDNVRTYIDLQRGVAIEKVGLTLEYLDRQLRDILEGTAADVMTSYARETGRIDDETGNPLVEHTPIIRCAIDELEPEVHSAIQSIKVGQHGPEVKMYSRIDALRLAYQRQGAIREGREISGPGGTPLEAPLFNYNIVGSPGKEPPLPDPDPEGA